MERLEFATFYSFKNITTPGRTEFIKQFVYSIEKYLRSKCEDSTMVENFEKSRFSSLFKSGTKPPNIQGMEEFEAELLNLPKIIQFREATNPFQREVKEHLNKMRTDYPDKVLVASYKTNNYYLCDLPTYKKVLTKFLLGRYPKNRSREDKLKKVTEDKT